MVRVLSWATEILDVLRAAIPLTGSVAEISVSPVWRALTSPVALTVATSGRCDS